MRPSLRILMTADAVGGVWVYAIALARQLCQCGCSVRLVTLGPQPEREQLRVVAGVEGLNLTITDLALEWMDPEGKDHGRALDVLSAIERTDRPDVVHLNSYREATGEWRAPVLVVAHSCVRSWWQACRGSDPTEPRWHTYAANVGAGLAAATQWAAPTASFRDTIEKLYEPPAPGRVIHNGLDGIGHPIEKHPTIFAAGRVWDEAKNIACLAGIAARVPWPVRVAGPLGEPGVAPRHRAPELHVLGALSRDELLNEMRRAAIFIAPAVYEPFGLTVLEAALSGCALILSDVETYRELWNGAALFIDPRDSRMIETVLEHLTRNEALRCDLQRRAVRRARRYTLHAMADAYRELYEAMADRHLPAPAAPRQIAHEARP